MKLSSKRIEEIKKDYKQSIDAKKGSAIEQYWFDAVGLLLGELQCLREANSSLADAVIKLGGTVSGG